MRLILKWTVRIPGKKQIPNDFRKPDSLRKRRSQSSHGSAIEGIEPKLLSGGFFGGFVFGFWVLEFVWNLDFDVWTLLQAFGFWNFLDKLRIIHR